MARWCQGHSGGRWVHSELSEKTILQLMRDQNGLNGLRTNSWFWLPSNSKAGGPQWWDSPRVRGRGGGGGGGGKLWQVQQVDRKSLIRGYQILTLRMQPIPGNPVNEVCIAEVAQSCLSAAFFFQGDIGNTNTAQSCAHAHTSTQSLAALKFAHTHRW